MLKFHCYSCVKAFPSEKENHKQEDKHNTKPKDPIIL